MFQRKWSIFPKFYFSNIRMLTQKMDVFWLIAPMLEAASASETPINLNQNIHEHEYINDYIKILNT